MGNSSSHSRKREQHRYDPSPRPISRPAQLSRERLAHGSCRSTRASSNGSGLAPPSSSNHRRTRSAVGSSSRRDADLPPPPYVARDDSTLPTFPMPQVQAPFHAPSVPAANLSERARYLQRPMRRETEEDALETLRKYNTIIVVDDSSSMKGRRWEEARTALSGLASRAGEYDADGIDIYFINSTEIGENLKNPREVDRLFSRVQPRGPTPIASKLEELLQEYMHQIESAKSDPMKLRQIKPINYIILTDGAPTDDPESVIVQTARRLDAGNFPISQVGIQFVQIGDSKSATIYLNELDDGLSDKHKIRDIVDTTPYGDIGCELNPDILIKILLGGVNRRVDKSGATVLHTD